MKYFQFSLLFFAFVATFAESTNLENVFKVLHENVLFNGRLCFFQEGFEQNTFQWPQNLSLSFLSSQEVWLLASEDFPECVVIVLRWQENLLKGLDSLRVFSRHVWLLQNSSSVDELTSIDLTTSVFVFEEASLLLEKVYRVCQHCVLKRQQVEAEEMFSEVDFWSRRPDLSEMTFKVCVEDAPPLQIVPEDGSRPTGYFPDLFYELQVMVPLIKQVGINQGYLNMSMYSETRRDKSLFKTWSEQKVQRVFAKMNSHYKLIDHTPVPKIKIPILPKLLFFHKCQELLVTFCTVLKFYGTSFIVYHLGSPGSPGNTRKSGWSFKAKVLRIS